MKLNFTNYYYFLIILLLFSSIPRVSLAQSKISGTVVDKSKLPLPGVSVVEKGTKNGTVTDVQGKFSLVVTSNNAVVTATMVGFASQSLPVTGRTVLNFTLQDDVTGLKEVVLIGYQKIARRKTTAAISSISAKELADIPAASFDQLLQGRVSGVNVQNFSGQPGVAPTVSVRGNSLVSRGYDVYNVVNSPLYVVDGIPQPNEEYVGPGVGTGTNYLAGINPSDIESIDVLKDASAAAIYGSRAANGVILITTKKGLSGEPRIYFNAYTGITQRPQLRDVTLGATERRQKMDVLNRQLSYADKTQLPYILTDSLNPAFNGNTDWQNLFYQTGRISNGDLSISGGNTDGTVYRFSGGYYDEDGIIKGTGFKRFSTRLNMTSWALNKKLMFNPVFAFSRSDRARGNGDNSSPISLGAGNMPSSLLTLDPDKRDYYLGGYDQNLDRNVSNQLTMNLNLSYNLNKHLVLNSQSSYLLNTSRRDLSKGTLLNNGQGNSAYSFADNGVNISISNFLNYNNQFGKHNFSAVAGQDILYNQYQYTSAFGYNGASDNVQVVQGFQQSKNIGLSDYQSYGLLSYYGRLAYDYDGRYLVSVSARTDGSSRFGANNKWGFFPSASVGWLISEEKFMKSIDDSPFTLVKLRASLGTSGSLPDANYLQYNLYNVNSAPFNGNYQIKDNVGNVIGPGATTYNGISSITPNFVNGAAQKGLSWERSVQWNIGTDIEIKNGKYAFQFDVYNKQSSLQLFSVSLPVTTGYDYALTNSIGVRNAGMELSVSANPFEGKFRWFTRLNVSYNKNQITSLPNGGRDLVMDGDRFDKSHILSIGSPINAFYLYQTKGVFSKTSDIPVNPYTGELYKNNNGTYQAGDFYLADIDGDGFIDIFNDGINPDKKPAGDPNPKYTGGWTNNFTYQNWSLGVFCTFTFDRDVLNLFESDRFSNSTDANPLYNFASNSTPDLSKINIWKNPGDNAQYAKYDLGTYRYYYTAAQTFFLEKGGYFRVKSVNLGYTFSPQVLKRLKINKLKVFAIADNLFMFQQSKRLPDAEAVNPYGEYNGAGYPIPKKYTIGLELQL